MTCNVSNADKFVRAITGSGLVLVAGLGAVHGGWQVLAMALGSVNVFTAAAGHCPVYRALGRSTFRA
jgi:hypothetical protein